MSAGHVNPFNILQGNPRVQMVLQVMSGAFQSSSIL